MVDAALHALSSLVRKSSTNRGRQWQDAGGELAARLRPMAAGLQPAHPVRLRLTRFLFASHVSSPSLQSLGLLACATGAEAPPEAVSAACALSFEFYKSKARPLSRTSSIF